MSPERGKRGQSEFIIIGGGPAGLSAAINAGSERVQTVVLDDRPDIGGQAALTSLVENYPGFRHGISGPELMSAMVDQALRFNTEFRGPTRAEKIVSAINDCVAVGTNNGEMYEGEVVLISTGVERKPLAARNVAAYKGRGVNYGPPGSPESYKNKTVVVIGAGNSAGQAAYKLSEYQGCEVHLLMRGSDIEERMSGYLIDKLQKPNVIVHTNTELTGVDGDGRLNKIGIINNKTQETSEIPATEIFVFIGATPKTLWVPEAILRDRQGYILAGSDLPDEAREAFIEQTRGRKPLAHETSMPGVFVAGDVRAGTNKRIVLAAGDGAGVVPEIHNLRSGKIS